MLPLNPLTPSGLNTPPLLWRNVASLSCGPRAGMKNSVLTRSGGTLRWETSALSPLRTPVFTDREREAGWSTLALWMDDCPHRAPRPEHSSAQSQSQTPQPLSPPSGKWELTDLPHQLAKYSHPFHDNVHY